MRIVKFPNTDSYEPEEGWFRAALAGKKQVLSVEYYEKPSGHSSPMHSHENAQVSIVLEGKMKAYSEENAVILEKMDSVFFKGNERHKIKNIGEKRAVGIDIFVPGRPFDFWEHHSK